MIIATAKAIRPRSSAAAKPMNRRPCWPSAAAGLRSAPWRNEPNTLPTPAAAAPTPIAARPAPITLAEARSILILPRKSCRLNDLVKMLGVVDVQRREQCENIGLDRADQQFERVDEGHEQEAQHRNGIAAT